MLRHFLVFPPAVHQMVLSLGARGLVARTPGQARSIHLLISRDGMTGEDFDQLGCQDGLRLPAIDAYISPLNPRIEVGDPQLQKASRVSARRYRTDPHCKPIYSCESILRIR